MQDSLMLKAIDLSIENVANGGGPFAALVVRGDQIIASGVNRVTATNDPTAHAEIAAIRDACGKLRTYKLEGCDIYTTCEPCPMCLGAIYWARAARVFYANTREDARDIGFDDDFIFQEIATPLDRRAIPMIPLLRERALHAFHLWRTKPDKQPY